MEEDELWQEVREAAELTGEFTLRSGLVSNTYFDKYRFESRPDLLHRVAARMRLLIPPGTEILGGLELGGVPLAVAIALESGHPVAFVRKEAKTYGTCRLAEGVDVEGKRVCLIEDVITTGGQVIESARELRARGAIITHVVCAIWRGKGENPLAPHGLEMEAAFKPAIGV